MIYKRFQFGFETPFDAHKYSIRLPINSIITDVRFVWQNVVAVYYLDPEQEEGWDYYNLRVIKLGQKLNKYTTSYNMIPSGDFLFLYRRTKQEYNPEDFDPVTALSSECTICDDHD